MKKLKNNWRGLKLWKKLAPAWFWGVNLSSFLQAIFPLVALYTSAQIINELVGERRPDQLLFWVLLSLLGLALIQLLLQGAVHYKNLGSRMGQWKLAGLFSEKTMAMDYSEFDNSERMNLLSRIHQNWSAGWGLSSLVQNYEKLVLNLVQILGTLILVLPLFFQPVPSSQGPWAYLNSGLVSFLLALFFLAMIGLSTYFNAKSASYWGSLGEELRYGNRLFAFVYQTIHNRKNDMDIRIYQQSGFLQDLLSQEKSFQPDGPMGQLARREMGWTSGIAPLFTGLSMMVVYAFVGLKAWAGAFDIGSVTQYVGALISLSMGLTSILQTLSFMASNNSYLEQEFKYLDWENTLYKGTLTVEKRLDRQYEIEVRNLSFKYPGAEDYVLKDVNFSFQVGERLAIVGPNGSGKTTFIKLLCRLYDPQEGQILLNGIDIRKYDYQEYMGLFSVVFQDFQLFAASIRENILLEAEEQPGRLEEVLEKTGLGENLDGMVHGLDTQIYKVFSNDGVEPSGGEAQKIALARALYEDKPFLILDEPTAALDPIAEQDIYRRLHDLVEDRTAVFISHRLSSCRFSDRIAVFDQGQVVEVGSHEELLAQQGKYQELWQAQAQYYKEEGIQILLED